MVSGVGLQTGSFPDCQVVSYAVPSPAAGSDFTITLPGSGGIWELVAVRARLVTSAQAANRLVHFTVHDQNSNEVYRVGQDAAIVTGKTVVYTFSPYIASITGGNTTNNDIGYPAPAGPYLPNWTLGSTTGNIDAGDQWSVISAWWKAYFPDYGPGANE